jgi:hypothetical protein
LRMSKRMESRAEYLIFDFRSSLKGEGTVSLTIFREVSATIWASDQ